jgi:hypothetical protein
MDAIDSDEVRSGQGVWATNERLPSPLRAARTAASMESEGLKDPDVAR